MSSPGSKAGDDEGRRGRRRPDRRVLLIGARRVVAQGADAPRHLVPGLGEVAHRLVQQHSLPGDRHPHARTDAVGAPTTVVRSANPCWRDTREQRRATRRARPAPPQAPRRRAPRPPTPRARPRRVEPHRTGKRHLAHRRPQAAIGTVVVSRQQSVVAQRIHAVDQRDSRAGSSRSGTGLTELPMHLSQDRAAQPIAPTAEVDEQQPSPAPSWGSGPARHRASRTP
jgi:hypothetical protein